MLVLQREVGQSFILRRNGVVTGEIVFSRILSNKRVDLLWRPRGGDVVVFLGMDTSVAIQIGYDIAVGVGGYNGGGKVRFWFQAPSDVNIVRSELETGQNVLPLAESDTTPPAEARQTVPVGPETHISGV